MNPYKLTKAKHKIGEGRYMKTYWNDDECAYVYRIDAEQRVFLWFYGTGASGNWVLQWMDNEGNQIGDAEYYANKNCLPRYDIERREG
jgi:hypothetical protein